MEIRDLYGFVLMLVLVGMLIGVGILTLDKFAATSGITAAAALALNNARDALAEIPSTWLVLLVTIVILGIIMGVVIKSFGGQGR
jgi:hypothetical protein